MKKNAILMSAILTLLIGLSVSFSSYAGDRKRSFDSVNKDIVVKKGERVASIDTVNGDIEINQNAQVESIDTVNGDIDIASDATVESIDTVNGDVNGKNNITVEKNIDSVNGDIKFLSGSKLNGNLSSVNGDVDFTQVTLSGNLETLNNDVILKSGTVIEGDFIVKKSHNKHSLLGLFSSKNKPKITLGENVVIKGKIVFNQEVKLKVSDSAKIPEIEYAYKK